MTPLASSGGRNSKPRRPQRTFSQESATATGGWGQRVRETRWPASSLCGGWHWSVSVALRCNPSVCPVGETCERSEGTREGRRGCRVSAWVQNPWKLAYFPSRRKSFVAGPEHVCVCCVRPVGRRRRSREGAGTPGRGSPTRGRASASTCGRLWATMLVIGGRGVICVAVVVLGSQAGVDRDGLLALPPEECLKNVGDGVLRLPVREPEGIHWVRARLRKKGL